MSGESIYKISKIFMIIAGIWKLALSSNLNIQNMYLVYSVGVQLVFVINILSMIFRIGQMLQDHVLEDLYINITLVILVIEITYKVLIYIKNKISYMFVVISIKEKVILSSQDKEIMETFLKDIRYFKIASFCQCFCVGSGILWFTCVNVYKKYWVGLLPNEHFMYEIWFPFDEVKHDLFVTSYNIIMAGFGFFFNSASAAPLQSLMVFATSQLKILQIELRRCINCSKGKVNQKALEKCVVEHQFLIEFVDTLNRAIRGILLLDYVMESINGAGGLLQLLSVEKAVEIPYCCLFIANVMINMFFTAWSANGIVEQSVNVGHAIYESNWMDQSEPIKKMLLIMITRAQRPLTIDIGPFIRMDASATVAAFKAMYSYATFMKQFRGK
ncbi:odorant receptor 49b-like [Euwallacea fornicatus]|uniref:odorant receptor 49b-like n=1 Tax=Euwallacea fornicatus TaxID=995702 RepID=UPI00338D86C6